MKFYDSVGPNPRVVRIFAAEKGITLDSTKIDLRGGENRQPAYMAKNPFGQLPALELDNGQVISEITALCEYLDEIGGGTTLIGTNAAERAETRMWVRRIDLNIIEAIGNGFRFGAGLKMFENRIHCIPQAADDFKAIAQEWLVKLDAMIAGRNYIVGDRMTLADILLCVFLEFGAQVGQPINPDNKNIVA
ncbi:MAG: glutathione S-transferase N-terminal domain-containing protein, partial [Acetobacteraceae bacterium]|nr:glutathione S-transferase N-terminal domain-containing protein [Acetobacteraceae bacterium]